jgi:hypothetical protein
MDSSYWSQFQQWLSALHTRNSVAGTGMATTGVGKDMVLSRGQNHLDQPTDHENLTSTTYGDSGVDIPVTVRINGVTLSFAATDMSTLPPDYAPPLRIRVQLVYEIGIALHHELVRRKIFFATIKEPMEFEIIWKDVIEIVMARFPNAPINWEFDPDFRSEDRAHVSDYLDQT